MENYNQLSRSILHFASGFKGTRSAKRIEDYIKLMSEKLVDSGKEYFLKVDSIETMLSQMSYLIEMPLINEKLLLKNRLFQTIFIQTIISGLFEKIMKEEVDSHFVCSKLPTLDIKHLTCVNALEMVLKVAAGEEVPKAQEDNFYPELKLYMSIMPIENFILIHTSNAGYSDFNIAIQHYVKPKKISKYKQYLEFFLRNLVRDIWDDRIELIDDTKLTKLIKHIQNEFIRMNVQPEDILSNLFISNKQDRMDISINIERLSTYGFSFDMPENKLNSMTPFYAAIAFDLHEKTVAAIKERSNLSTNIDDLDLSNLNLIKLMYDSHRDVLLKQRPNLFVLMLDKLNDILFPPYDLWGKNDELNGDLPKSMFDEPHKLFFDIFKRLLDDEDFFKKDENHLCVLNMICIIDQNYLFLLANSGADTIDSITQEGRNLNQDVIDGKNDLKLRYEKFIQNEFYNDVFNLLMPYSPALKVISKSLNQTSSLSIFDENQSSNKELDTLKKSEFNNSI